MASPRWSRTLGLPLAGALALAAAGCTPQPPGPPVVVLFPGSSDDDWGASAEVLRDELADDGYEVEVRFAGDDIPRQLEQLSDALDAAPAAVVLAPVDVTAAAAELAEAEHPEVAVISYDRLALDAPEVDYYATFDHVAAGRLQAQALLDGLAPAIAVAGGAPVAVELLAGSGDDPAAQQMFAGALEVLRPAIDAGTVVVPSGRTELEQAAILRGDPDTAAERVAELLDAGVRLAGVLSPSDAMSAAVAETVASAGAQVATAGPEETAEPDAPDGPETETPVPGAQEPAADPATPAADPTSDPAPDGRRPAPLRVVLTGGGSALDGVRAVAAGTQTATVYEDPRELARAVASMVRAVVRGGTPEVTRGATTDNGVREVPTRLLDPVLVERMEDAAALLG